MPDLQPLTRALANLKDHIREVLNEGKTWLDAEELAYPAGSLRQSRRTFQAVHRDTGAIVKGIAGIPDTAFTVPARARVGKNHKHGYLTVRENDADKAVYIFHPVARGPNT